MAVPVQPPPSETPPNPDALPHDASARCRLLEAAVDIFGRKGYAGTSVREIVERANVTKPVLYYHFGSKEGLMMAIIDGAAREVSAVLAQVTEAGGSAREHVFRLFDAMRKLARTRTSELRVVHAVYYFAPELLPTFDYTVFERMVLGDLEGAIRSGIASGELRNVSPTHAAIALGSVLGSFLDQEMIHSETSLKDTDLKQVLDLVFEGLCPTA